MINLIELFIKKAKVNRTSKIDKISSKSINDVLKPIYFLSTIFGLRVFEFPRNHSRPILSFIYSMSLFSLSHLCWSYRQDKMIKLKSFNFEEILGNIFTILNNIMLLVLLLLGLYHSNYSKICAKKINEIDKTLQTLGSPSYFNSIYKRTICEITIVIIYLIIQNIVIAAGMISYNTLNTSFVFIFSCIFFYFYFALVEFMTLIDFITVVRCIKSEFKRGNELLSDVNVLPISSIASEIIDRKQTHDGSLYIEQLLPVNSKKLFTCVSSSKRQTQSKLQVTNYKLNRSKMLLRTIRQIHLELYRISKCFSKMYGIQISLEIAICILSTTFTLYDFYEKYMKNMYNVMSMTFQFVVMILCLFQYFMKIFMVNYVCDKTSNEAKRTNEIIHTFYGKNTDTEIRREVEVFSMQMMQFRSAYSAFGLYNFNCKQICSCIGIITTHLVILIQVADSFNKKL